MTTTMRQLGVLVAAVILAACGQEVKLQRLALSPDVVQVVEHLQVPVTATAVFSDGTTRDVTAEVTWGSQDDGVAAVVDGVVQAAAPGRTLLTATWSGQEATAPVEVAAAALLALQVVGDPALPVGVTAQLYAMGDFSDGTQRDVSDQVEWSTYSPAVELQPGGAIRAVQRGPAEVWAVFMGLTAGLAVEVTAAAPVALTLEGLGQAIPVGLDAAFQVLATYTDGSVHDVTAEVQAEISNPAVADLPDARHVHGRLPGYAELMVTFAGLAAASPVRVAPATVQSIVVEPPGAPVAVGSLLAFSAIGRLSDGTTRDLTDEVTWSTSDAGVAEYYGFVIRGGFMVAARGSATITAADPVSGLTGSYALVVGP